MTSQAFKNKFRGKSVSKPKVWSRADRAEFRAAFHARPFDEDDRDFLNDMIVEFPAGEAGDDLIAQLNAELPPHVRIAPRLNQAGKRVLTAAILTEPSYPQDILDELDFRIRAGNEFPPDPEQ